MRRPVGEAALGSVLANAPGAFRPFVRLVVRRGERRAAPMFSNVEGVERRPLRLELEDQAAAFSAAVPEVERGARLVAATMGLRPGEVRALHHAAQLGRELADA